MTPPTPCGEQLIYLRGEANATSPPKEALSPCPLKRFNSQIFYSFINPGKEALPQGTPRSLRRQPEGRGAVFSYLTYDRLTWIG